MSFVLTVLEVLGFLGFVYVVGVYLWEVGVYFLWELFTGGDDM